MWPAMELVQHQKTSPQEAGQDHQRGTLWTHTSVQTSCLTASKGPSRGLRHGCANCRCPCAHFPTPTPPVFITCCDITACKQSASRFWIMCSLQHKLDQKIFPVENVSHQMKIPFFLKQNPPILHTEQAGDLSEN